MSDRLNMSIGFEVKTADDEDFMKVTVEYFGLRRDQLMEIEGAMLGGFGMLLEATKEQAKDVAIDSANPGVMR